MCKSFALVYILLDGGPEDENHCPVRKQVTFAKTHKTGSSTIQNILFRYGQRHNLSFAFPQKNTWMFNLSKPFQVRNVSQNNNGLKYQAFSKFVIFFCNISNKYLILKASNVWRAGGGNMRTLNDWMHPSSSPPGPFDLFVFHSIWNYNEIRKVMPKSAATITILRDPVNTFESGYSYFGRAPKVLLN